MTVTATSYTPLTYNGNGSTSVFNITFQFYEVAVIHIDSAGSETEWTENTHYTVTGGKGSTGSITVITTVPATGEKLRIERRTSKDQPRDYDLDNAVLEAALQQSDDRLAMILQELDYDNRRRPAISTANFTAEVEFPTASTGNVLSWGSDGNLANTALVDLDGVAISALSTATSLEDTDLLPLYDNSVGDNASISWGGMKSALSSLTLDHFAEGGDGDDIWHTSGRDLVCNGKRAMVGFSTGDDDILAVNYATDFEWLDLYGKHRNNISIVKSYPGIELLPTNEGEYSRIDYRRSSEGGNDYNWRSWAGHNGWDYVLSYKGPEQGDGDKFIFNAYGNIWTNSYGWLHDKFADQNGPQLAKAWASIDGTGTVVANGSYGFSQIQDMGSGKYRCTFSTARPNANYCTQVSSTDRNFTGKGGPYIRAQTTTYVEVGIVRTGIGHMDEDIINVVVFGD